MRQKIYDAVYWKQECFGLSAERLVDKAVELKYVRAAGAREGEGERGRRQGEAGSAGTGVGRQGVLELALARLRLPYTDALGLAAVCRASAWLACAAALEAHPPTVPHPAACRRAGCTATRRSRASSSASS